MMTMEDLLGEKPMSWLLLALAEPLNGQVLMVLSMDNNCSATSFDMELCAEKLKSLGVQVAADEWRRLIQDAVLTPEVRRYMFYNSRVFQIAIAVVFYVSLWTNIYSMVRLCSFGRYWEASVLVTLAAVVVTVVVILVIDRRQRKINMNTDVRLAAVNEIFIKHSLILGITDALDGPHNILQLWFVHFSPERCLQSLSAHITDLQRTREVMAQQLLVIFSGCYVRLLVTGQLPRAVAGGHLEQSSEPCLCQFIETTVLNTHRSWFMGR
ncbi:hypothetical protein llap_15384 [Limosa lapponica baueri]|uniref:Transmembrane protein 268 n=1 Tax=Limosa lapponica baueri TaxID=1758121 RepID=A0A2I0TKL9_LIMLA|nr:hypothetical protein llap_15384 [Limosa lapponica baueri]